MISITNKTNNLLKYNKFENNGLNKILSNGHSNNYNINSAITQNIDFKDTKTDKLIQNIHVSKNLSLSDKLEKSLNNLSDDKNNNNNLLIPYTIEFKHSYTLNNSEIVRPENSTNLLNKTSLSTKIDTNKNKEEISIEELLAKNSNVAPIGKGLNNIGNTCFLNSTLQTLIHCTPLINLFFKFKYTDNCNLHSSSNLNCMLCNLGKVIINSLNSKHPNNYKSSFTPSSITQNIRIISKFLRIGRQEDSHEFLIKLLEAIEINYSKYVQNKEKSFIKKENQSNNIINKIFVGKVNSIVECGSCKYKSETECEINHLSLVRKKYL